MGMETSRTSPLGLERVLSEIITPTNPTICHPDIRIPIEVHGPQPIPISLSHRRRTDIRRKELFFIVRSSEWACSRS